VVLFGKCNIPHVFSNGVFDDRAIIAFKLPVDELDTANTSRGLLPEIGTTASVVILLLLPSNAIPSVPHVGPLVSVPSNVPSPPSEYAVVPVPAFCSERNGHRSVCPT
jgi:hypothetical protein